MDRVETLVGRYFKETGGKLLVGNQPVNELVEKYGTPLYIYDSSVLAQKWSLLRSALPHVFEIFYSIKANPNPSILNFFLSKDCGLEVASKGELERGLNAGCTPENILFAGPGKTESELEFALLSGVGELHVESLLEIKRVSAIAQRLGYRANVAIRVNPSAAAYGGGLLMGGKPSQFGIDEEMLDSVLDAVIAESSLELCGLHFYLGTQILDASVLVSQYSQGLEIAGRVVRRLGRPLNTVDFGGGLGIPYFPGETELDIDQLRGELAGLAAGIKDDPCFAGTRFIVEPGRYLVGEGGIYVVAVNDIKVSRGRKFLITDGGMNHHLAASGNLGQVLKRNYPVALINKLNSWPAEMVDVVGPLCTPLDMLARQIALPVAEIGDLVGVFQSGAYARSASPLGFLSHPAPPEVWIDGGKDWLVTPRGRA
jgi:diaminopimelate decarboxylase